MFSRNHVDRFIQLHPQLISAEAANDIKKRAKEAATKFDEQDGANFSGSSIGAILGDQSLEPLFDQDWERGKLHPQG